MRRRATTTRLLAIFATVLWLVGGALAAHHRAHVAHTHDARTADDVHAHDIADHRDADDTETRHFHRAADASHDRDGACHVVATTPALVAASTRASTQLPLRSEVIATWYSTARTSRATYRLAPKTSPPLPLAS